MNTTRNTRRVLVAAAGGLALALAAASAAFACTVVYDAGSTTITAVSRTKTVTSCPSGSPTSCAAPGDTITATGVGPEGCRAPVNGSCPNNAGYVWRLHFLIDSVWSDTHSCMGMGTQFLPDTGPDVAISGPVVADASTGAIPATTGVIPGSTFDAGTIAQVCFIEAGPEYVEATAFYATPHVNLTIVLV